MTKDDAIEAMYNDLRVTHELFSPDEFIYLNDRDVIVTEEGYNFEDVFVERNGLEWKDGWSIYAK